MKINLKTNYNGISGEVSFEGTAAELATVFMEYRKDYEILKQDLKSLYSTAICDAEKVADLALKIKAKLESSSEKN